MLNVRFEYTLVNFYTSSMFSLWHKDLCPVDTQKISQLYLQWEAEPKMLFAPQGTHEQPQNKTLANLDRHTSGHVSLEQGLGNGSVFSSSCRRPYVGSLVPDSSWQPPTDAIPEVLKSFSGLLHQACTWYAFRHAGKIFTHIKINKSLQIKHSG